MPGRQRSSWRHRRSRDDARAAAASGQLTQAFFACEQTFDRLNTDIGALRETGASPAALQHWAHLQHRYETVLSVYLALNQADPGRLDHTAAAHCATEFRGLEAEFRRFGDQHRGLLDEAAATVADARAHQDRAVRAADEAQAELAAASPEIAELAVIVAAAEELARRRTGFDRALGLADRTRAAGPLQVGAQTLRTRLAEAPGYAAEARRLLGALTTRTAGVQTRLSMLPETLSTLRREFSADCSQDVEGSQEKIGHALGNAQQLLDAARTLPPDRVIAQAETVRDHLDVADDLLRSVVERLRTLQDVRADPSAVMRSARFSVRDAQRLAVAHGLTDQWGPVLDAQSERLDRAAELLDRIHPDYWRYLQEIDAVDRRIDHVVSRMRDEVARRR
ncbi:MAG: hypothetical protein QM809_04530 [Gordonia sp. (in: high G+C Gram-positive bacteria)]|uniref:hypothetical protein n=1 Tax=Gordonia sp. (in: high G+C Gram-positive bacteria) TaxID=84139 RepID=UPI0039E352F0